MLPALPDFATFFREATAYARPWQWQERLVTQLQKAPSQWPRWIALPTGTGKTSLVLLWAYVLAAQADAPSRTLPLRLAYIIDRRLIVDAVSQHAQAWLQRLQQATPGTPLHAVAERLRAYGGDQPLVVRTLRGGQPRDAHWILHPSQPAVLVSTIDQAGSRLLFRGYGVPTGSRSLEAGLLGIDTLFVVDEAHLAMAFLETLDAIQHLQAQAAALGVPGLQVLALSATPPASVSSGACFALTDAERAELAPRLEQPKYAWLDFVHKVDDRPTSDAFVQQMATHALTLAQHLPTPGVVGVFVNRVATALQVAARLRAQVPPDTVLVVHSRQRPWDRQRQLDAWLPYLQASARQPTDQPRFVVATQTLEVGVDWDFDALVTELAPLPALVQRFGRLNRLGRHREAWAVIVDHPAVLQQARYRQAVYPPHTLQATRKLLQKHAARIRPPFPSPKPRMPGIQVDVAAWSTQIRQWQTQTPDLWDQANPAPDPALPLYPSALRHLTYTTGPVAAEPHVPLYLHGLQTASAPEVQVLWREAVDLTPATDAQDLEARFLALAPHPEEMVRLPLWAVRRWLHDAPVSLDVLADLGTDSDEPESAPTASAAASQPLAPAASQPLALVWSPERQTARLLYRADDLAPEDWVIVPADRGGLTADGWDPTSRQPVPDLGNVVALASDEPSPVLRVLPAFWPTWFDGPPPAFQPLLDGLQDPDDPWTTEDVLRWLTHVAHHPGLRAEWRSALTSWLQAGPRARQWQPLLQGDRVLGLWLQWTRSRPRPAPAAPVSGTVLLSTHQQDVLRILRGYLQRLPVPPAVRADLETAAQHHDDGKADPRWQCYAWHGDRVAWLGSEPIAKHWPILPHARAARAACGLPPQWRHEWASLQQLIATGGATDLALHLIGSHHGYGRPWFPPSLFATLDAAQRPAAVWDPVERFHRLQAQWGPWGLAWLEALLRLADWNASAEEAEAVRAERSPA